MLRLVLREVIYFNPNPHDQYLPWLLSRLQKYTQEYVPAAFVIKVVEASDRRARSDEFTMAMIK